MKKLSFILTIAVTAIAVSSCTRTKSQHIPVIPQPFSVELNDGQRFILNDRSTFRIINADDETKRRLYDHIVSELGIVENNSDNEASIVLKLEGDGPQESYRLDITPQKAEITAPAPAGLFYGIQTMLQLNEKGSFPCCRIEDKPRFAYRGVMLDVSRHWFGKEHIKKQIDILSRYKINHIHLHLTDAAGWRIETEKYPRLTELAAWRADSLWKKWWNGGRKYVEQGSKGAYGGYFTKDDIREIVKYAEDRYVTIVPEIEMPSHSEEVMAAYPELSCTKGRSITGDLCIGNEDTFIFMQNVLDEIMELFPSKYIHIGGDEAAMNHWKSCPLCQQRMEDENLQTVYELQGYLIRRIEKFIQSRGREIIGWDEILEGGTSSDATVMCWRGIQRGITAAEEGHDVIMTPGGYCYFDSYQDAPYSQPEAIGGYTPIEKVYSYNPAPDSLSAETASRIYGVQANLWAEYIPAGEHMEYMLYPRALALAEIAWSDPEVKDFQAFRRTAIEQTERLRSCGVNAFDLAGEIGNRPEAEEPAEHLAVGKPVTYAGNAPYYPSYTAGGDTALTDGIRGGWSYGDNHWQGFVDGAGLDVTIDLGEQTELHHIGADFMQICGPDVFMPAEVIISVSDDGQSFNELTHIFHNVVRDDIVSFKNFAWDGSASGRYVRYRALHGQFGGFIFTDEIIVR